ncbi:ABC transporter substrate-binding protein [Blastococcus brunescens]|uniref:ABC transporter substrate-binding protein n=1 Tax=Blastococcus brunescens TaxID=1564165 RepID=A0ABZ1AYE6_9ACTN|nr:ABC transporter substrate-binding protein [Blastococcus sp. BMG 8361]WRL63592.1 ABC transporter substrate-binding protein [Blastococcus sp. BMG 8361]
MHRFGKRHATAALLVSALLAAGCGDDGGDGGGGGGGSEETLKVGLFLPEVGPFAGNADAQEQGFRHYVENVNDGMLSGYEVEIVTADTANDPAVARENVQRLVERDEVDVIVGVISSAVAYAIAPYLAESGVPTIFTATAADDLTQRDHTPNIFRTSTAASQIMLPAGTYACEVLGYETAAMVSLDYAFGYESNGGFARAFEDAGCEVVQEIYSPLGTADWGPVVQNIDENVDVIVQTTSGSDAVKLLQAYRDFGLTDIPMLANGFGTDPSTLPEQAQRELATGIQSVHYYSEGADTPANQEFQEGFREAYGQTAGAYAEATYVAAMVLEAALADIDELSYESLIDAMADVTLDDAPGERSRSTSTGRRSSRCPCGRWRRGRTTS